MSRAQDQVFGNRGTYFPGTARTPPRAKNLLNCGISVAKQRVEENKFKSDAVVKLPRFLKFSFLKRAKTYSAGKFGFEMKKIILISAILFLCFSSYYSWAGTCPTAYSVFSQYSELLTKRQSVTIDGNVFKLVNWRIGESDECILEPVEPYAPSPLFYKAFTNPCKYEFACPSGIAGESFVIGIPKED